MFVRRPSRHALTLLFLVASCAPKWTGSVGAVFGKDNHDGRLYVRDVPPDMGAGKVGLRVGDEVTAVDGKLVSSMSADEVHKALSGPVGTKVKLAVQRAGQSLSFEIERGPLRGE